MKLPENLTSKVVENAMRIFEKKLKMPQMKALKTIVRGIMKHTTTIISHLHEHEEMETKKFIEKHSYHLGNIDIIETIQRKAIRVIHDIIQPEETPVFISYDESDIFKPSAEKMPGLSRVRDGSTGLTGNGYVFRGVNINGISLLSQLDEVNEKNEFYEKKTKTEKAIAVFGSVRDMMPELMTRENAYFLYDRGGDDIQVIDNLLENSNNFVIRMKKNRNVKDTASGKTQKITAFGVGKHRIKIEVGTTVFLHVIKKREEKEPILLITNNETLDSKTVLGYYLKRWKIEEDFNKMKDLGLENIRLMSLKKIQNLIAIIQFIIILAQDVFNDVMQKADPINEQIYLFYAKFCKRKSLTLNPQSFIKFISAGLVLYKSYDTSQVPLDTLFGGRRELKKMGMI